METRRRAKSSKASEFKHFLENLHAPVQEGFGQMSSGPEHSTLAEASKQEVDKLLDRVTVRGDSVKERSKRGNKSINYINGKRAKKKDVIEGEARLFYQRSGSSRSPKNSLICGARASTLTDVRDGGCPGAQCSSPINLDMYLETEERPMDRNLEKVIQTSMEDVSMDDAVWEVGSVVRTNINTSVSQTGDICIEFDATTPGTSEKQGTKRLVKRATAKDKELAELVHKVHLLCLIARGRIVDAACDNQLLQASLLSMLPPHVKLNYAGHIAASDLDGFVNWFQRTFQIRTEKDFNGNGHPMDGSEDFDSLILGALHRQSGSCEEVAALSVALLRASGLTVRYVSALNVVSLKPNASALEDSANWRSPEKIAGLQGSLSTTKVLNLARSLAEATPYANATMDSRLAGVSLDVKECPIGEQMRERSRMTMNQPLASCDQSGKDIVMAAQTERSISSTEKDDGCMVTNCSHDVPETGKHAKRKGDVEFEMQLAMAMAATEGANSKEAPSDDQQPKHDTGGFLSNSRTSNEQVPKPVELQRKGKGKLTGLTTSGAVWSRRKEDPWLHWAEVYCGAGQDGRWVHVDAGRGHLDEAEMVGMAASGLRAPLRYVLAFAGNGAKDVTRRYVQLWSTVVPLRVDFDWWSATMAPLKKLEAAATSAAPLKDSLQESLNRGLEGETLKWQQSGRSDLEDMELEVRSYTEPLPTNQQAYKSHHLYALEKWLTKYQTLHPRGPVLGYCSGQPVFPRTCVQELHTAERWLRVGFKVKDGEAPAKTVKNSRLMTKRGGDECLGMVDSPSEAALTVLFGKWQTEPWQPLPAVGGIVPKNERGNVELWSEKCLPPGTVHISLPRILPVVKRLEIDFAQAMVGFEIRNRKSVPVFEGIVVCQEYEAALLEAYAEEEYRRNKEMEKRREKQAIDKWCQLFRSVAVRQRLQATYNASATASAECSLAPAASVVPSNIQMQAEQNNTPTKDDFGKHEHSFPEQHQSYDDQNGIWTKVCPCGFVLAVEEM